MPYLCGKKKHLAICFFLPIMLFFAKKFFFRKFFFFESCLSAKIHNTKKIWAKTKIFFFWQKKHIGKKKHPVCFFLPRRLQGRFFENFILRLRDPIAEFQWFGAKARLLRMYFPPIGRIPVIVRDILTAFLVCANESLPRTRIMLLDGRKLWPRLPRKVGFCRWPPLTYKSKFFLSLSFKLWNLQISW